MDENTKLFYDVIIEQVNLAKERLSQSQYHTLLESLDEEIGTRYEEAGEGEGEEDDDNEGE